MTQEQFAEKLYVSRTAVSKWESGKGYPSIDSLKYISKLFNISIDELLSSEEILDIAENENVYNINKFNNLVYSLLDMMSVLYIFLICNNMLQLFVLLSLFQFYLLILQSIHNILVNRLLLLLYIHHLSFHL